MYLTTWSSLSMYSSISEEKRPVGQFLTSHPIVQQVKSFVRYASRD